MTIYVPATGPESWSGLLADPVKHWRKGYSARTLACCWQAAAGLPPEIGALFGPEATLLIGIPEHKVDLPRGRRPSQTDLFALVRRGEQTISCAIEGKVGETFGPTIQEWLADALGGEDRAPGLSVPAVGIGSTASTYLALPTASSVSVSDH